MGATYFCQASTVVMVGLLLRWRLLTKSYGTVSEVTKTLPERKIPGICCFPLLFLALSSGVDFILGYEA